MAVARAVAVREAATAEEKVAAAMEAAMAPSVVPGLPAD